MEEGHEVIAQLSAFSLAKRPGKLGGKTICIPGEKKEKLSEMKKD